MVALKFICFFLSLILVGCTYSISMQHSVGSTDTVEESQTATPNISPTISGWMPAPTASVYKPGYGPISGARGLEGQEPRPSGANGPRGPSIGTDWS